MSRYVQVAAPALHDLDEVARGLRALGLPVQRGRGPVMLEGSLECAGEPVDLRLPEGTAGSVEDFGFVQRDGALHLVCGEVDQALLIEAVLEPLRRMVAEQRIHRAAEQAGLEVETEGDRLILRRR